MRESSSCSTNAVVDDEMSSNDNPHLGSRCDAGFNLETRYGAGRLLACRSETHTIVVQLAWGGRVYGPRSTLLADRPHTMPEIKRSLEQIEQTRRNRLIREFRRAHVMCDFQSCALCILPSPTDDEDGNNNKKNCTTADGNNNKANAKKGGNTLWRSFRSKSNKRSRSSTATKRRCLICLSSICREHASKEFWKEQVEICISCVKLFDMDFDAAWLDEEPTVLQDRMDQLCLAYERGFLLSSYARHIGESVAVELQEDEARNNGVSLGASAAGVLSGALGVAGAATLVTPLGPPLLMASLFVTGSGTALQLGSSAANLWSEPERIANRIIAVDALLRSIVTILNHIQQALARDPIWEEDEKLRLYLAARGHQRQAANNTLMSATSAWDGLGSRDTSLKAKANNSLKFGSVAVSTSSSLGSTVRGTVRTVQMAPVVGTALSAALIFWDAHSIGNTISKIHAGNPCAKAQVVRDITCTDQWLSNFPLPQELEQECRKLLALVQLRRDLRHSVEDWEDVRQLTWKDTASTVWTDDEMSHPSLSSGAWSPTSTTSSSGSCTSFLDKDPSLPQSRHPSLGDWETIEGDEIGVLVS